MIAIVEDKRAEIADLCERYGVGRLDLFGSAGGTGEGFDPEGSDLEFVVSFERRDPPNLFRRHCSGSRKTWRHCSGARWTW